MKNQAAVKILLDKIEEVVDMLRGEFRQQFNLDIALRGFDEDARIFAEQSSSALASLLGRRSMCGAECQGRPGNARDE